MGASFRLYHLHGLGSSCKGTKATAVKNLVERKDGEFFCFDIDYLKGENLPWRVVERLSREVSFEKPTYLVGSSMGAYTWLDFLAKYPRVLKEENLKRVVLITPPITLFDNLEKWNPRFEGESVVLTYGEEYRFDCPTFVELLSHDLKGAPLRLLTLAEGKVVSILARRDTVVDNSPVYGLAEKAKTLKVFEIDDEHHLGNSIPRLVGLLEKLLFG